MFPPSSARDEACHLQHSAPSVDYAVTGNGICIIQGSSLGPASFIITADDLRPLNDDNHITVIGHVTIGLGMGHFLLVVLWIQVSISNGF